MNAEHALNDSELGVLFACLEHYATVLLAVSGGADSMALLHLVARWRGRRGSRRPRLIVATVDHGLRPGSADEAAWVGAAASAIGLPHRILRWEGPKPSSGIQEAARDARYRLLSDFARREEPPRAIVTAHHRDDQVETFLMRLARGSGLDGLSGMSPRLAHAGYEPCIERPLLDFPKARLVATLEARGLTWIDDPSNEDRSFERVRVRAAVPSLGALGLGEDRIARSVRRLRRARAALDRITSGLMRSLVETNSGAYANIDRRRFDELPEELRIRLLARLLASFGGQEEPARLSKVERLNHDLVSVGTRTLSGCVIVKTSARFMIFREFGRAGLPVTRLARGESALWDRRFRVSADGDDITVQALGVEGYAALGGRREIGPAPPYRAAIALPSFWRGDMLIGVPHLRHRAKASSPRDLPLRSDHPRRNPPPPQGGKKRPRRALVALENAIEDCRATFILDMAEDRSDQS